MRPIRRQHLVDSLAMVASGLLHPLLLPTWAVAGALWGGWLPLVAAGGAGGAKGVLAGVVLYTAVLPLGWLTIMISSGLMGWRITTAADRRRAMWGVSILLGALWWPAARWLPGGAVMGWLFGGVAVFALLATLINEWYRISAHVLSIMAWAGLWLSQALRYPSGDWLWPLAVTFLLAGISGWARLKLGAHRPDQVATGALVGGVAGFLLGRVAL